MRVRYIYSACVCVETENSKILCDPWFTQGIYHGTWYHYPPLPSAPISIVGKVDAIYVSHIHPDHYDRDFLRKYLEVYPETRILIAPHKPPILRKAMERDGFNFEEQSEVCVKDIRVGLFPNAAHEQLLDIDSAAAFAADGQFVINMNDNSHDPNQVKAIKEWCRGVRPSLGLFPYTGASSFPQMYHYETSAERRAVADRLNRMALNLFQTYNTEFEPVDASPFAGQYWLGGPLSPLNTERATMDAVSALPELGKNVFVFADGGESVFDCTTSEVSSKRTEPYSPDHVALYLSSLPWPGYEFENDICMARENMALKENAQSAFSAAVKRNPVPIESSAWICLKIINEDRAIIFNPKHNIAPKVVNIEKLYDLGEREEITIDPRLLFGLLTRVYHWDNAYIGSLYKVKRVPDVYHPDLIRWLNFFHV